MEVLLHMRMYCIFAYRFLLYRPIYYTVCTVIYPSVTLILRSRINSKFRKKSLEIWLWLSSLRTSDILKDKERSIVPISFIKNFAPKDREEFDGRKSYWVKWNGVIEFEDTPGSSSSNINANDELHFEAQILMLGGKYTARFSFSVPQFFCIFVFVQQCRPYLRLYAYLWLPPCQGCEECNVSLG